ncbi:hypothetical protein DA2_2667 [Desulfovibrio sp. A2]|nr:hypothetical protein DA2_2667 [Desulfovibrio sp. A2]
MPRWLRARFGPGAGPGRAPGGGSCRAARNAGAEERAPCNRTAGC